MPPPLLKRRAYYICIILHKSVGRYVISLNRFQLITQERFAPEAPNLVGR